MNFQRIGWLALSFFLVACATSGQSSPASGAPGATASPAAPAPAGTSGSTIALHEAPANIGCDSIGVDYTSMTFHIDPAATEGVSALTNTGVTLVTYWAAGFQAGAGGERAVRDPSGEVVVSDGDVLQVPPAAYPRLGGYFVCLAPTKLYVLLNDPA
jgi:hypothetical protein